MTELNTHSPDAEYNERECDRLLDAAKLMAAAIDLLVYRGLLDERSIASDARLVFGQPYGEEQATEMLSQLRHAG